jgi:hypothetical protein
MFTRLQFFTRWSALASCSLIFAILLVACGWSGTGGTTSTPVPTSTSTLTLAPTTPPASPPAATGAMIAYPGNGFTISYAQTWQISRKANNLFTFTDSTGGIKMTITVVPDPNGAISADTVASTALKAAQALLKNAQTVSVPTTTTVGGESWSQIAASGTQRLNNQNTNVQVVVLADVHPANTPISKSFTILYQAPASTFSQDNKTYFQPMLQSFKFA